VQRVSARSYAVVSWHICNLHLIHFLRLQQVMMGLFIYSYSPPAANSPVIYYYPECCVCLSRETIFHLIHFR
jgi:hypothetical protein